VTDHEPFKQTMFDYGRRLDQCEEGERRRFELLLADVMRELGCLVKEAEHDDDFATISGSFMFLTSFSQSSRVRDASQSSRVRDAMKIAREFKQDENINAFLHYLKGHLFGDLKKSEEEKARTREMLKKAERLAGEWMEEFNSVKIHGKKAT